MEIFKNVTLEGNISGVTAMIGRKNHKIIYAIRHSDYNRKKPWTTRQYDIGMALVCLLVTQS